MKSHLWKGTREKEQRREEESCDGMAFLRVLDSWRHLVLYDAMAAGAELLA